MAIDPKTIQWDAPPQTVGKPVTGSVNEPLGGGVIIPAAPEKPNLPSPTRETERWTTMTPEEVRADPRLNPSLVYQRNAAGKIEVVGGAVAPQTTQSENAKNLLMAAGVQPTTGVDPVADLIRGSTSGPLQSTGAYAVGAVTGEPTPGMVNIARLKTIAADLTLQLTGGNLGAGVSNTDRTFLVERIGNIADPNVTAGERLAAWQQVKDRLARMGGIELAPPEVTLEQSTAYFGQPAYDANGKLVGSGYNGTIYDANGQELGLAGGVTDTAVNQPNTAMEGVGQGLGSMVEGGLNSTIGLVTNPVGQLMYNAIPGNQGEYNTGQIVREALGLPANTDPMGNAIIQGATGAMTGAGLAGMAARALPGMAGQAAATLASQPIQQVAGGAGAGAGAEFIREQGGGTGAQIAGGLLGGMAGAGGAGIAQALGSSRVSVPAAVTAAERAGIPVMTSDVAPPQTFMGKNLQQAGERIPIAGTGGLRASQQDARIDAVKNVLMGYGVGAEGLPDKVWRSVSAKRSSELAKYVDMKKQAIGAVNSAGDVPITATNTAIDDELARLTRISPEGFAPVISILRRWKSDIQGKNLEDIEILRKQIGEEFKAPELAAVSGEAQKSLNRIYNPLREDMGAFIRANGGTREANKWMIANRRLSDLAGDLDKQALKSVLRNGDATPEVVNNLLFSQKRSDVAALYRALTPEGRANARAAVMDKVFQDIGGDFDAISPEKFITSVRKQGNAIGVMFAPDEAERIGGLVKALKLTRRAGEAGVLTNSGQQGVAIAGISGLTGAIGGLLGGSAATGGTTAAATIAAAGAIGGIARVMESRAARNILLQLNKAKPQEEAALVKRLIAAINATKDSQ